MCSILTSKPLDLSLLDRHFGDIKSWRTAVDEIHQRGMYVMLDNTMSTYVKNDIEEAAFFGAAFYWHRLGGLFFAAS